MKLLKLQYIVPIAGVILCLVSLLVFFYPEGSIKQTGNRVINIADGDSFEIAAADGTVQRVRLYGIDSPEAKQKGGKSARSFTEKLLYGQAFEMKIMDSDQYGRDIVLITLSDGRVLNEELVRAGQAWVYRRYCDIPQCKDWKRLEAEARKAKQGLWANPRHEEPWVWRYKNPR